MSEREDFPKRFVTRKYLEQDGVCANPKCMNPLDKGMHRHHISGDSSDDSYENIVLFCMECHHAIKDKEGMNQLEKHHEVERHVFEQIEKMVEQAFDGKLSGANMERMMDGFVKQLQISRYEKGIDVAVEYPPAEIKLAESADAQEQRMAAYWDGFKQGVAAVKELLS